MEQEQARLAVVIVSYNTCALLETCLRTLLAAAERATDSGAGLAVDVVVVDNASADGSAGMVTRAFPQVTLVALEKNVGFTGGNNAALRLLGLIDGADAPPRLPAPDFVLLLNPDTEVEGDALTTLVRFLREQPQAGVCGPRLRYGDGRFQHGAFAFPGVAQVALDLLPLDGLPLVRRLYASRVNGRYPLASWEGGAPFPVDFVLGAALLARAEVVRQVGGLDEGYFMYCEEMDWCLRVREAGRQVYAVPGAVIVHHEGQSSRQVRWTAFERLWRSRLRFYAKQRAHFGPLLLPSVRALVWLGMGLQEERARRRFARGARSGVETGEEVRARRAVAALCVLSPEEM